MLQRITRRLMLYLLVGTSIFLAACEENKTITNAEEKKQTYTCSMHPQIVQDKPGTCPICGMDLVLFDKNNKDAFLTLSESQITLANVSTVTVGSAALTNSKLLNGRLNTDPQQSAYVSSRVAGRIENLYVKETGVRVSKGQPLYRIYSEQLATLQQEYLVAAAQVKQFPTDERFVQIEKAARQKLLLYDQSTLQINKLVETQEAVPYVTYSATVSGVVAEILVTEGQYVIEGGSIMRLEGYNELWVEADIYPAEAGAVSIGQRLQVIVSGWENEPQNMVVQFINPSLQSGTQLLQVRGTIPNVNNQWQAGLQASILLPVKTKGNVLTLPVDAVIRDGKGSHVWIATGEGKFEPRMVETGMEDNNSVEITKGIEQGEEVVVTGSYLLFSEYILKKGAHPMAAHNH
ncbi:efflux RND transporter periplasmic adaptor subunit [Flavitalea antarctica]